MTKLESGAIVPNTARHDLGEIVGSALRRAGKILAHHKVALELASDLPMLELDAVLFEQVVFNLLDNAAKYAPADTTVAIRAISDGGFDCLAGHGRRRRHPAGRTRGACSRNFIASRKAITSARHGTGTCHLARFCGSDAWHDLGRQPQ